MTRITGRMTLGSVSKRLSLNRVGPQNSRGSLRVLIAERSTTMPCPSHPNLLILLLLVIVASASCQRVEAPTSAAGDPASTVETPEIITGESGVEMVLIPAGRFQMGNNNHEDDEAPAHEVRVDAFLIDRCEVTQAHWAETARGNPYLSGNPSHFKGPDLPVEMVRWDAAALYCNERSRKEGLEPCYDEDTAECNYQANGYRLPTEAEWERACRAGADEDYCFGPNPRLLKQYAWYADNASKKTHPVGQKKPNAWGLFDMHGNVAEWCNDVYSEDYYKSGPQENPRGPGEGEEFLLRGGAWNSTPAACRSSRRVAEEPGFSDACFARDAIGFRCVRKAPVDVEDEDLEGRGTPLK